VAAAPDRFELHHQDETPVETNPYLSRVWHRRGQQPTIPAAGTNRRLTVFGSVEVFGRGRVEVLGAGQPSADFLAYLEVLDMRHVAVNRELFLVLDNGPCHRSKVSEAALAARADWLHVIWLPKYCPQFNRKEREWRYLKRDARGHLARTLRAFADGILAGLARLGGERLDIVDRVPDWFLVGHRKPPTGRPRGRPTGRRDSYQRSYTRCRNLPAAT
jgi:transposase